VLSLRQPLVIKVPPKQRHGVLLTVDGQDAVNLEVDDKIYIRQAAHSALLIYADKNAHYTALGNKFFRQGDIDGEDHA
jgi:NAD kinase